MAEIKKLFNEQCLNEATTELIEESATGQKRLYISRGLHGGQQKEQKSAVSIQEN